MIFLIEHKINELTIEKRKISMINYEYIFIKIYQKEIEEIHKNLKPQEEEMQEKIAINSSNREKMLAKLLEETNSEN